MQKDFGLTNGAIAKVRGADWLASRRGGTARTLRVEIASAWEDGLDHIHCDLR